ncbi:MAG: DUF533 domain-containing protein [Myxococcales bacterium]|nr:DUF533 domain-containing protein [Myxococcales bacterium]
MSAAPIDKRVFLALSSIAWADGKIEPDEADGIVRAAIEAGLELDDVADIEAATAKPIPLESIDLPSLSKEDRIFVYAMACWLAAIDDSTSEAETAAVQALGEALGVPEKLRAKAEGLVNEVGALPEDRKPARYDLDKLRALIGERLASPSSR